MTLVPPFHGAQIVRFQAAVSPGSFSEKLSGRRCEPRKFRAEFSHIWMKFIHAHFQSPLHVAVFFDVDEKTARDFPTTSERDGVTAA